MNDQTIQELDEAIKLRVFHKSLISIGKQF